MQISINRQEPQTGGPSRTPREQIEPVFGPNDEVEPDAAIDASSSEGFTLASGNPPVWGTQMEALRQFVVAAEQLDSQAAAEQAGGDDDKGGIYCAFFNQGLVKIGTGDDDGDLNSTNMAEKVAAIRVRDQDGKMVPLPYGGTVIMPTISYLDKHYLEEFARDEGTGQMVPVAQRPKRARSVFTDGAMRDYRDFANRLADSQEDIGKRLVLEYPELRELISSADMWPQEQWFIAIFGEGTDHDNTLRLYQQLAETHKNLHVYSFEGVTNAAEIAEDMAVAVLATTPV